MKLLTPANVRSRVGKSMGRSSRMIVSLRAAIKQRISQDLRPDDFELPKPPTLEEQLERRRSELRNGLTDRQRLFLFGKLSGLNDKDAAIAAGYSVSVAENTKQRIWKPQVRAEFERLLHMRVSVVTQDGQHNQTKSNTAIEAE